MGFTSLGDTLSPQILHHLDYGGCSLHMGWLLQLEGTVQAAGEEWAPAILLRNGPCMLQYQHARQGMPTGLIVAQALVAAMNFLIGFMAYCMRGSSCLVL